MQDKLQELTDKLFNEGLSKGKQEGEAFLAKARKDAEDLVAEARKQAAEIVAAAEKKAADMKSKAESDIRMAGDESMQAIRKSIESAVVAKVSDLEVSKAMSAPDFLKGIIKAVAEKFSAEESADVEMVLPQSLKAELEPFVKSELSKVLGNGSEVSFSGKVAGGLTIGPKDGGYFISLTDETFKSLIADYLRPATRKVLFGE